MTSSRTEERRDRRESDHRGFNGWIAKWGEPANLARLLGSFLAVIFAAFTLIIGGYAWNMKIDDRSLDNRALASANKAAIAELAEQTLQTLDSIEDELSLIRQTQIKIMAELEHSFSSVERQRQALIRHENKEAHDAQSRETARAAAHIRHVEDQVDELDERVRAIEKNSD